MVTARVPRLAVEGDADDRQHLRGEERRADPLQDAADEQESIPGAAPQSAEETVKSAEAAMKRRRRPKRSPSRPPRISSEAIAIA